jgi:hypothetical protein
LSTGFKDWDVPVNISSQTLSEVVNRPTYGTAISSIGTFSFSGESSNLLLTVLGTGMLYGGFIYAYSSFDHMNDQPTILFENQLMGLFSFYEMLSYSLVNPYSYPLYLTYFDITNNIYSCSFSYGYTFEEQLKLMYYVIDDSQVNGIYSLNYALI